MMLTAESLARDLGAKRNGRGWRALCPAHDDRTPSLDIDAGDGGRVLLKCRAGCEQAAVIDALKRKGLWANGREHNPHEDHPHLTPEARASTRKANGHAEMPPSPPRHPQLGEPHLTFDYFDAKGVFIGSICRWNTPKGKQIRPARWSGDRWEWKGFDEPHPLYRLPDLVAQPSRHVVVVEGEKAADIARELVGDMVVTTWPHGAQAVSKADWTPLKDRHVVLWPDADEPGAKAMRDVGAILRNVGARSIRLVKLPSGLPSGWDLADPLPNGFDPVALIEQARDIAAERVAALGIFTAAELLAKEFKEPIWAVPDIVPEGLTIIAGKPKTGKSWMALDFAIAVAGGSHALCNIKCEPGDVLLIALEDTPRRLHGRIRAVLQGKSPPAALAIATTWKRTDEGGLEDIRAWLATHRSARLVVIDTLQKVRGARKRDAGVYADDYAAVADIKKLADEFTVPILLVHHLNKEGNSDPLMAVSGTAGITGSADTILVLQREPNDSNALLYIRGRDVLENELAVAFDNETGRWAKLGKGQDWRISEERRAIVRLLTDEGPMAPKDIAEAVGKRRGTIRMTLSRMAKDGTVTQLADGRYSA
jgi:AAA domain